ncbi:MAG: DMT family transporter [Bradyrhizobiaceae bacterium]|nr:DMT family transporter [Bradyrhizobiaceae bacterium]
MGAVDLALFATVVIVWGTSWLPLRLQLGVVAPEVSGVWRFGFAAIVMFGWLLAAGARIRFGLADHFRFALLGALLFCFNFLLAYYSGFYLTSGLLAVVFSLAAVINPLLAAVLWRTPPETRVVLGAILGAGGVALLFGPEILATEASRDTLIGLMLVFGATLFFCSGNILSAAYQLRGIPVLPANTWCMFYGTLWFALIALLRGESFIVEWSARYFLSIAYLAIPSTVVAFAAYLTLLGRIGAGRAAYSTVLVPVVALVVSTLFESYQWTLAAALGVLLVVVGNAIVLSRGPAQPRG